MNGLSSAEKAFLHRLRLLCREGKITEAKNMATSWIYANKRRQVRRLAAARTVKNLFAVLPKSVQ